MPARIVIASYDKVLKEVLSRNISGSNIQVDLAYNIVQSEAYFSSSEPNVLIFDIDNGTAPSRYISLLLEKYNLLIVLTGSDPKKAFDFYKYGVKDYIIKPKKFNSADGRELIVAVTERIKKFFSVVNDLRPKEHRHIAVGLCKIVLLRMVRQCLTPIDTLIRTVCTTKWQLLSLDITKTIVLLL